MHVGGGWTLNWAAVVEWALHDDPELQTYCNQEYVDTSERWATCAVKMTEWFESKPDFPQTTVTSHPAGKKTLFFLVRYMGFDQKGTLAKFKKFRELPKDVELRHQMALALNIPEDNFKWVTIPDPFKQDRYL